MLDHSTDPYDIHAAVMSLSSIGTERSVPALNRAALHRTRDVSGSAVTALARIAGHESVPFLIECLNGGRAEPWSTMLAIEEHGDASAVDAVLRRVKKILGRSRKIPQGPRSELSAGLGFLWRFRHLPPVTRFFADVLPKRENRLFDEERAELERSRGDG